MRFPHESAGCRLSEQCSLSTKAFRTDRRCRSNPIIGSVIPRIRCQDAGSRKNRMPAIAMSAAPPANIAGAVGRSHERTRHPSNVTKFFMDNSWAASVRSTEIGLDNYRSTQMRVACKCHINAHADEDRARKIRRAVRESGESFKAFRGVADAPRGQRARRDEREREADTE